MNSVENRKSAKRTRRIRLVIFFIIFIFMTDYLISHIIFRYSLLTILWAQKNLSILVDFCKIMSILGSDKFFLLLVLIFYNYVNVYKTFLLSSIILISSYIANFLKMIYMEPRPYWISLNIEPLMCEGGWGNPSGHALTSTAVYLTIWKFIFSHEDFKNRKIEKYLFLFYFLSFIFVIMFSRVLLGLHSIDQTILGFLLGICVYYIMFKIIRPNSNNPHELLSIILLDDLIVLCINSLVFTITFVNFYGIQQDQTKKIYNTFIEHECPSVGVSKRFEKDAMIGCFNIHLITVMIVSMRYEFRTFREDYTKWVRYNFTQTSVSDFEHLVPEQQAAEVKSETYTLQWNHTGKSKSLLRLLLTISLVSILMTPYFIFDCNANFFIVLLLKYFIPLACTIFFLSTLVKKFFSFIGLSNISQRESSQ